MRILRPADHRLSASILAGCVLLAIAAWLYLASVERSAKANVRIALLDRQSASQREFDEWLDLRVRQARDWAIRQDTRELTAALLALPDKTPATLNAEPHQVEFRKAFSASLAREGLQGYFIIAPDGTSIGSLGLDNTGTPNLLWQEPEFVDHMKSVGFALSPLMTSDVRLEGTGVFVDDKSLTLFVGVPIILGDGQPAAYFTVRIPPISLLALVARARFGEGGISYLVDRQGRLHADRSWLTIDLAAYGITSEPFRGRRYVFVRDPGVNLLKDATAGMVAAQAAQPASSGSSGAPQSSGSAELRSRLPLTKAALGVREAGGYSLEPYRDHRGVEVVGTWTWDSRLGLGIVTEMPVQEAFAPVAAARQHLLVAAVLIASLAVVALLAGLVRSTLRLRDALATAESSSRAKGTFLANMSHEIRTPMNAIIGLTHLMSRDVSDGLQRTRLKQVGDAAHHLLQVINDVLDMSKIEAGKLELEHIEFSLETTVARAFELVSERAREAGLELVLECDQVPGTLMGDPTRLSQMLINLLSNAVKFTNSGWVRLHCRVVREEGLRLLLRFDVQDTGEGISPARQQSIFKAFEQADASTTRRHGGTGLGLALTREFALAMGGEIGVTSEPGKGSTFWFTAWHERGSSPRHDRTMVELKSRRAILVDDLPEALNAIGSCLSGLGLSVDTYQDPNLAIDKMAVETKAGRQYDVMLIDWRMDPIDGIETLRRVRAMLGDATPRSILITAADEISMRQEARAVGYDDVLLKPITASMLHDSLSRIFGRQTAAPIAAPDHAAAEAILLRLHAGQRVLLAEDNPINREVAQELLRRTGLIVESVENGRAAFDLATSRHYDVVLMDMQMPVMDGLESTRLIRARMGGALPIIAMTANAFAEDRDVCLAAGMNDHVAKPVDPGQLYGTLLRWLPLQSA